MKPLTREWLEKGEGDFVTAQRELRARKLPNYDSACFHAQQCAEKYLKAFLQEYDIEFGKTHNLTLLLDKAIIVMPLLDTLRQTLQLLGIYAVDYRYPGESADRLMAKEALKLVIEVRSRLQEIIGVL